MTPCSLLPWDSEFFHRRIARVTVDRPTPETWPAVLHWCQEHSIDCLYYLAEFDDLANIRAARELGFDLMDLRLTLDRPIAASPRPEGVRVATTDDIPFVQAIARGAFPSTRFSRDPELAHQADRLYETWILRNVETLADRVLVATTPAGDPAGFVSCHLRTPTQGELGLTAVRSDQRGRGVGSRLVAAATGWFHDQGLVSTFVVTNGGNIAAQRLYQRHGFLIRQTQIWYHRWTPPT